MFKVRGRFDVRMDAKGRLPLPARLREKLAASGDPRLVLAAWDGGLQGFTAGRWAAMERRFAGVSMFDAASRDFLLAYVASAAEVAPDKAGRINVPPPLRRRAGLDRDCVVVSFLGVLEIWSAERFEARHARAVAQVTELGPPPGVLVFDPDEFEGDL